MKELKLKSRLREGAGKKAAHKLRSGGEVPVILYGHKEEPLSLAVPGHEIWHILHNATSEHLILKLTIEDVENGDIMTLVRDVQHHPVSGDILHVDLQRISIDEEIKVGVPVNLTGIARGVKEFGGILDHGVREVMIRCKPTEIPESMPIDVSDMEIGESVHISDIQANYPQLEFLDDMNVTLAHISPPTKITVEEEEEAVEGAPAAEGAEGETAPEETAGEGEES